MWILDTVYRNGVDVWYRKGSPSRQHYEYDPPFFLYLPNPDAFHDMITVLEEQYRAEPCTFRTLFGELTGFSVHADRRIAEMIEQQSGFDAQLFNVDIRRDQQFMAERNLFPCSDDHESRFTLNFTRDLSLMEIRIHDNPAISQTCTDVELISGHTERLQGTGDIVISDLFAQVQSLDPDVILMSHADTWLPKFHTFAQRKGCSMPFSRSGRYRRMNSRSYWSYGRVEHKEAALIPDGRILIDTNQSFVYREGGLEGVFMASRLSGLSPNLTSRFTPGTLISSYEIYESIRRGIAVPFRKAEAETQRKLAGLRCADRGGMMFQPEPGIYYGINEIDFTSMYPSIIVQFNLSPETLENPQTEGFLASVLAPVVDLRRQTKLKKARDPRYAGIDSILKWMLVTCFGYTGYKNAKFGRIEVHEAITARSREILLRTKSLAEARGFTVLHGIVDCLWVKGSQIESLKEQVGTTTGLSADVEYFDWIVFLPLNDGFGSYNRYYGRLSDGSVKVRGIAARRHDTPEYIRIMQQDMLDIMRTAKTTEELDKIRDRVYQIYRNAVRKLPQANPRTLAISRRISRTTYAHQCIEGAAVVAYRNAGVTVAPGMIISYVVRDVNRNIVDPEWRASTFDHAYYRALMEKAWTEIAYAFVRENKGKLGWEAQEKFAWSAG